MSTRKDVEISFTRMARAAAECGLDVGSWSLDAGSPSNGVAWALRTGMGGASDVVGLPFGGQLGRSAKDAERTLDAMAAAFESVAYATRRDQS